MLLAAVIGGCKLQPFGEILPEAEVSGVVLGAGGTPVPNAHVSVELHPVVPDGQPDAGQCRHAVVAGGGGTRTDARGRYDVRSRVALASPLAACVRVRAALPPASAVGAPATAGPVLRWAAADGFARATVDVAVAAAPAP